MKKSNFQTVGFTIIFMTMNGHTYKFLKNIFNDVQTEGKGEINNTTQVSETTVLPAKSDSDDMFCLQTY